MKLNHIQILEHLKVVIDCVFDTRYQREHIGPTPIQPTFKFSAVVADVISHALVLTKKIVSVNSDGNKMIDIVSDNAASTIVS